jgi:regulator of sigma E protease
MDILWYVGAFILILSPIIFVHELGHFLAARFFDIEVEEFGIGFPPRALTLFERNGTKYTLNWIPLGGFVRPAGEDDPNVPGGLSSASKTARFTVLVMGAVFNFIFAFFVLWGAFAMGQSVTRIGIGQLLDDNVVAEVGLQTGDIFIEVNGKPIGNDSNLLVNEISSNPNTPIEIVYERDGLLNRVIVAPKSSESDPTRGALGVGLTSIPTGEKTFMGIRTAAAESVRTIYEVIVLTLTAPAKLIQGSLSPAQARPISVVGISQIAGTQARDAFDTGDWFNVLFFTGIISVGLGFTNLLPIPALDGGRILFVLIEALRGQRIPAEREGLVHMVGMLLLLSLMALMIVNDVINPILQ